MKACAAFLKVRFAALILNLLLVPVALLGIAVTVLRSLVLADQRAKDMLFGLDVFGNVGLFKGSRFESISSHVGREVEHGTWWAVALNWMLDLLEPGHCLEAWKKEKPLIDYIEKFKG